jgi:hypothetical protein
LAPDAGEQSRLFIQSFLDSINQVEGAGFLQPEEDRRGDRSGDVAELMRSVVDALHYRWFTAIERIVDGILKAQTAVPISRAIKARKQN